MSKKSVFIVACLIGGLAACAWFLSLPLSPTVPGIPDDIGWRSIQKTANGWERGPFQEGDAGWKSYQQDSLLIYGRGPTPQVDLPKKTIDVSAGGEWFLQLVDSGEQLHIKAGFVSGGFKGGTIFVTNEKKTLMDFDTEFTTDAGELVGPSFMLQDGKQTFFDIGEQSDLLDADMWGLYTVFIERDEKYVLGSALKTDLDSYIQAALDREPITGNDGAFKQDFSARNGLEEIKTLVGKIDRDEPCGTEDDTCFMLLDQTLQSAGEDFPDVFIPLQRMIQSWVKGKKSEQQIALTWQDIFAIYHDDIINENPRAKVKRDNAILQMIRTSKADATYDVWKYLTNMLAKQKIGSAYSIQIMREMIRIGDTLSNAATTTPDERATFKKTALESLTNLRSILENTYFIKKDYLFLLRSDLVDSEGKPIQTQVFVDDLQSLVSQVDSSTLFQDTGTTSTSQVQLIRGQLAWFTCILSKNATYIKNPRVCRTVTS